MTEDKRTEREIIAEAYSDEARATWKAPVQVGRGGSMFIPWDIHLEAYEAYCKKWSKQTALIDLKGRGCRGGFGTEELDGFVPGWRDRVTLHGRTYIYAVNLLNALMGKHFPEAEPLQPLPDTMGVLTQIDNLTTALHRAVRPITAADILDFIDTFAGQENTSDEVCDFVQTAARYLEQKAPLDKWRANETLASFVEWHSNH